MMALGSKRLGSLFGNNVGALGSDLAGYSGVKPATATSLLGMAAPLLLSMLGKMVKSGNLNLASLAGLLTGQKDAITAAIPGPLSRLDRYVASAPVAAAGSAPVAAAKPSIWRWLAPLLIGLVALWLLARCMGDREKPVEVAPPPTATPAVVAPPAPEPSPLVTPSVNLYFDVGKADLPADIGPALAPIVDYLNANASAMAVVSGYQYPAGDQAANEELAKNRAAVVRDLLVAAGVAETRIDMQKPVVDSGEDPLEASQRVGVTVR
jgi:outer membrane protein OmpA-like peptidoglycan-associated protein